MPLTGQLFLFFYYLERSVNDGPVERITNVIIHKLHELYINISIPRIVCVAIFQIERSCNLQELPINRKSIARFRKQNISEFFIHFPPIVYRCKKKKKRTKYFDYILIYNYVSQNRIVTFFF